MVWRRRPEKLLMEWRGPFVLVSQESPHIFEMESLLTGERTRVQSNTLHLFLPGNLTANQLKFHALEDGEYLIESVLNHRLVNNKYEFRIKYLGYELAPEGHPDAWTKWDNCRFSPEVKEQPATTALIRIE